MLFRSKQNVILVDHNSFSQSAIGIEEAEITEVIDHHNLGAIGTNVPINFRSMPVGCTCTIIYYMFLERKIAIPKAIAGLMLSAILSDTMIFKSPTTTISTKSMQPVRLLQKENRPKNRLRKPVKPRKKPPRLKNRLPRRLPLQKPKINKQLKLTSHVEQ